MGPADHCIPPEHRALWSESGISDTSLRECEQADKALDHVLQTCPKYAERRHGADLVTKLWGSAKDLYRTAGFVASTGLKISPSRLSIAEEGPVFLTKLLFLFFVFGRDDDVHIPS